MINDPEVTGRHRLIQSRPLRAYIYRCALCANEIITYNPRGKWDMDQTDADRSARNEFGWHKTALNGWTCPDCYKGAK